MNDHEHDEEQAYEIPGLPPAEVQFTALSDYLPEEPDHDESAETESEDE